jgi:hypothetical protein
MLCALFVVYVSEFSEGARRFCHHPAVAFSQETAGKQAITNFIGWIWTKKELAWLTFRIGAHKHSSLKKGNGKNTYTGMIQN